MQAIPIGQMQPPYNTFQASSGTGIIKSDSMNSGTSTGSSTGRVGRRKRGSNASGSGTSSNSGSRPNSNVDLSDSLELENETLRGQLQVALKKLKKYEQVIAICICNLIVVNRTCIFHGAYAYFHYLTFCNSYCMLRL